MEPSIIQMGGGWGMEPFKIQMGGSFGVWTTSFGGMEHFKIIQMGGGWGYGAL